MPPSAPVVSLARWVDPDDAVAALCGDDDAVFWLDAGPDAAAGWSWIGRGVPEPDPRRVRSVALAGRAAPPAVESGPFRGGWVGWIDYETGASRAGAPTAVPAGGERWLRVDDLVAFDHATRRAFAIGPGAHELADRVAAAPAAAAPPDAGARPAGARHTPARYAELVEECRARIRDGDAYQLCLTTRFEVAAALPPVDVYRRLRRGSPSHHGGLIRVGGVALASATPERFLEVDAGVVRTHPIKGTRPRGHDAAADAALVDDLRVDPKERAENVMIVDLMRNDLSRVCRPGSVGVDRLLAVETYPAVHQLVSSVSGELADGTTLDDLLVAAFPAGSMTGTPKLSAMTILNRLESGERGAFAGCFGWVGDDGRVDLAMVIRTVVLTARSATVGAGGGITWRSRAADEVREVALKARAPLAALGASLPPGW